MKTNEAGQTKEEMIAEGVNRLYKNDGYKLKILCDNELNKFGIADKDRDYYYSRVSLEIGKAVASYDPDKANIHHYLMSVIKLAIKKELTKQNRAKRKVPGKIVSIYDPVCNDEDTDLMIMDTIPDPNAVDPLEAIISEELSDELKRYLNRLSALQRKVLELVSRFYSPAEVMNELHINRKTFDESMKAIRSPRNTRLLLSLM